VQIGLRVGILIYIKRVWLFLNFGVTFIYSLKIICVKRGLNEEKRADLFEENKEYKKALEDYRKIISLNPTLKPLYEEKIKQLEQHE